MAENINADMAANVWKILVSPGDVVEEDDTLLILEAMKMEIPVTAEDGGKVLEILVAEGESVAPGQPLFSFESE
ncbi:acetyl-CoA carboxylase biotin carboxyl carrier protein subunit [Arthrobacter sp. MYb227]|uniref:biotin/lipoyl-binding carrier protein n=1 Tax=Arthrobacter sp. MYb227 TaxID=1848601 RepID=UPI000CFD68A1|nr:biotin/lipoyl-binding carrier protein [Arthrobacter sp. MYb227]PQZ94749.1 acetyl-CoA carboxylase biotin carboxyl carrier protein subunit [Arthrobacter sp. MYb227]